MDWYPLWNSLRIALISCAAVFFLGIFAAYYIAKLPRTVKGVLDVVLTLPMVLPPHGGGLFSAAALRRKAATGPLLHGAFRRQAGHELVQRHLRLHRGGLPADVPHGPGAFESFDETLAWSAQTLGQSNTWIFWRVRMPCCRQGILAGTVLAFARALGEYGATSMIAGYTPAGRPPSPPRCTSSGAPTRRPGAMRWVLVDIVISAVVLLAVNLLEKKQKAGGRA